MIEEWRTLLYPLGFLANIAFAGRFIVQWLQSEIQGRSVVTRFFWRLSLIGNLLLALHTFIQMQYPICLVQSCNAVISWRNLNLMQREVPPISFRTMILLLLGTFAFITAAFALQDWLLDGLSGNWFRIPLTVWQQKAPLQLPFYWHVLGSIGYLLFSSRFWIQWWSAEKSHKSQLNASFWWLSLGGAILSTIYFLQLHDIVNLIGPVIGLIPYIRNLMLIHKAKQRNEYS